MNTTSTSEKSILLEIVHKLTLAQQELDDLAVQLALGKAEATDKFEEVKKEFGIRLATLRENMESSNSIMASDEVKIKLGALEKLLTHGKVESKDLFEKQKEKIVSAITDLEHSMKSKIMNNHLFNNVVHDLEKFKLKLEILHLRFSLKKFEVTHDFKEGMRDASDEINKIWSGVKTKLAHAKENYNDFQHEIIASYQHIRKAVKKI